MAVSPAPMDRVQAAHAVRPSAQHWSPADFGRRRILVVGDVMLDRYYEGTTLRISPEAPVPVVRVEGDFQRPGGAANVALNLSALGVPVTLLSWVGDDHDGEALADLLRKSAVDCVFLKSPRARTIVKLRVLSRRQQVLRLDFEDDFAAEDSSQLAERFEALLADHALVVMSDYAKGVLSGVAGLISAARRHGATVLVDPKGADFTRYSGATVITPNASEFAAVAGSVPDEAAFVRAGEVMRQTLALDHLLVTRGEQGMILFSGAAQALKVPAHALDVYDVTGAGDTAIAALAAGLAIGLEMQEAVRLANRAAGIVVGRKGTATVTAHELLAAQGLTPVFTSVDETVGLVHDARRRGECIVMTNGCFDVLHAGHVEYLTRARALGDRLVVAVNSDASVARLKGQGRPVNRLEHRMAMLSALKVVDFVVPFDGSIDAQGEPNDTPLDVIVKVSPDILVKGADYGLDQIVGAREVIASGGQVLTLPYVAGLSTTSIIQRVAGHE